MRCEFTRQRFIHFIFNEIKGHHINQTLVLCVSVFAQKTSLPMLLFGFSANMVSSHQTKPFYSCCRWHHWPTSEQTADIVQEQALHDSCTKSTISGPHQTQNTSFVWWPRPQNYNYTKTDDAGVIIPHQTHSVVPVSTGLVNRCILCRQGLTHRKQG